MLPLYPNRFSMDNNRFLFPFMLLGFIAGAEIAKILALGIVTTFILRIVGAFLFEILGRYLKK